VRRLVVILMVAAIMASTMVGAPLTASAQNVGQPVCGPWQQARYVSVLGWPYIWNWRWCHNPSEQGDPYYIDWASWNWVY
jgi:hypothetical protein